MLIKTKRENQAKATTPNLDCVISIRMKNDDLQKIKESASAENRTISNYIKTKLEIKN
jgi:predicted DNA binding CopG/RHH family protein